MAVLVSGASGFLGGRLVEMLVERGEQVTVVARMGSRVREFAPAPGGPAVQVLRTELSPAAAFSKSDQCLREAARSASYIYHCAGCSTDWASPATYHDGNVLATRAMLAAAAQAPELKRFVHVSTTDVYGYPRVPCPETGPLRDVQLGYNHTKILGEQAVWAAKAAGLPVTVLRPATIYGPHGTAFVTDIAKLLRERTMAYVGGGRVPGGFVYVDDVCAAMMAAAHTPAANGEAFNLSSLRGESWKQYCVLLAAALGLPAPWINLPFGVALGLAAAMEAPHRYLRVPGRPLLTRHAVYLLGRDQEFPSRNAQTVFGYAPRVSLEEGVARSAAWLEGQASG